MIDNYFSDLSSSMDSTMQKEGGDKKKGHAKFNLAVAKRIFKENEDSGWNEFSKAEYDNLSGDKKYNCILNIAGDPALTKKEISESGMKEGDNYFKNSNGEGRLV